MIFWIHWTNPISHPYRQVLSATIDYFREKYYNRSTLTLESKLCGCFYIITMIARFMGLTWGPSWANRTQVGPILAPWTLLSGKKPTLSGKRKCHHHDNIFVRRRTGSHHNNNCQSNIFPCPCYILFMTFPESQWHSGITVNIHPCNFLLVAHIGRKDSLQFLCSRDEEI